MSSKKQPIRPNSDKVWKRLFIALLLMVIIGSVLLLNSYLNQQVKQKEKVADDIKFARIETFVDLVKTRLDQDMPEGKWTISEYCSENNVKGTVLGYTCFNSVQSEETLLNKDKLIQIFQSFSKSDLKSSSDRYDQYTNYSGTVGATNCSLLFSHSHAQTSIGCSAYPNNPPYEVINKID